MKPLNTPFEVIIPSTRANLASFVVFAIAAGTGAVAFASFHEIGLAWVGFVDFLTNYVTLFITLITGTIAHEGLHAIGFIVGGAPSRSVRFGFSLKDFAPYTHCSNDLPFSGFVIATLLPGIVLGIIPFFVSILLGDGWLFAFSCFFTAGAGGDFLCASKLISYRTRRIKDHPDSIGFIVL